jgi:glucose-6-phosphate isomerase
MFISYFDDGRVTAKQLEQATKKLKTYRDAIAKYASENDHGVSEASLYYARDFALHETISTLQSKYKSIKHLLVIGIGGSSLGLEAVAEVLGQEKVKLSVLDTVSAREVGNVLEQLLKYKKAKDFAVCVISKSGNTTETLANASVVLHALADKFGAGLYEQVVFIGNPNTTFSKSAKKLGAEFVAIPEIIGGRYSVATAVGLVPMALLGYDVDEFIEGFLDASEERFESLVTESAGRLYYYHKLKYYHYNFFAFEPRLVALGAWYRQLMSESLGKETDVKGQNVKHSMVPAISTPVELHSTGQLYMSGVPDTYTDFVTFDDDSIDMKVPKAAYLPKGLSGYTLAEVATGLYGGVVGAYQERQLPFRATVFEESLPYSLGLFMAMRLREIMYTAHLLEVNAFDQPNVELYKVKTKEILSI